MKAWQGSIAVSQYEGIISPDYLVCSVRPVVEKRFLHHLLRSSRMVSEYLIRSKGIRPSQWRLYWEDLADIRVNLPSPHAQVCIADLLDVETARIDALIDKKQRILELIDERFWVAVEDMILSSGGCAPLRRVLLSITDGPFGSAFSSDDYVDEGPAVVRLGNIGFAEYRPHEQARISVDLYDSFLRYAVFPGDLLIAALGDDANHAGRACVAPASLGPAIVKGKCFCARVDSNRAQAEYLALVLSTPYAARLIGEVARGSTRSMINLEIIKTVVIPLPSVDAQRQIVERSHVLRGRSRGVRDRLHRQISLLQEHRQALITAAVRGEMDVPGMSR